MEGIPTPGFQFFPLARGNVVHLGGFAIGVCRLPADSIGVFALTLYNVVVGSRIAVRDQGKTTVFYNQIAATPTVLINLPVYANGSPLNNQMVDIRKASSPPYYQRYKTLMVSTVGASTHYVNQLPD